MIFPRFATKAIADHAELETARGKKTNESEIAALTCHFKYGTHAENPQRALILILQFKSHKTELFFSFPVHSSATADVFVIV